MSKMTMRSLAQSLFEKWAIGFFKKTPRWQHAYKFILLGNDITSNTYLEKEITKDSFCNKINNRNKT